MEETKGDKRKAAKRERVYEITNQRTCNKMYKGKGRNELIRQKHKFSPVIFQWAETLFHCTGTGKWSAGVISVTSKEVYAQHGVSRGARAHRERGTCLCNWPP